MSFAFADTPYEAPDAMFELKAAFDRDTATRKLNLGPGAYLDNEGRSWILPAVSAAETQLQASPPGHEYLPILGLPAFRQAARSIAFGGDSPLINGPKIATLQTISGTGAIRIAVQFLKLFYNAAATVYVSDPSWSNHRVMFEYAGFKVEDYPYYDTPTRSVAFTKMLQRMEAVEDGGIFVLQACGHNPTGCDLTHDQWSQLAKVLQRKNHIPLLDNAYQGFAGGSLEDDGWSVRHLFSDHGLTGILCQSFSKSMGLYGERVGAVHVVLPANDSQSVIRAVESQIGWISRKEISTPVRYGATIASTIITTPALFEQWKKDLVTMSSRIKLMREKVLQGLKARDTPGDWSHVVTQVGMFSYTGLTEAQVLKLREKSIYLSETGRISVSGLNDGNVDYFCDCVDEVVRAS
ncbi:hypothetical protein I317_00926 [Kwoniella heveanensis CBS 569]|nr:hypothetical protein I317_00926 [Kwoniella heveanensis CBS 569]